MVWVCRAGRGDTALDIQRGSSESQSERIRAKWGEVWNRRGAVVGGTAGGKCPGNVPAPYCGFQAVRCDHLYIISSSHLLS